MKGVFEKKEHFELVAKRIRNFKGFPPMFHPHCELIYVLEGEVHMMIDEQERTLRPGELSVVFPYTMHSNEDAPEAEVYMILLETKNAGALEEELLSRRPICPYLEDAQALVPLFSRAVELKNAKDDPVAQKAATVYVCAILSELLLRMRLEDAESTSETMVKPILFYCSEHFSDESISIKQVADALYISSSYVSKVFSGKLKYGFREYVNELRVAKAKKLLAKTDWKIVDIMLECGFRNQSSFNRVFGDLCGVSPREYRARKLGAAGADGVKRE